MDKCLICGRPIVLINMGMSRGIVTLQQGWVHRNKFVRSHAPKVKE